MSVPRVSIHLSGSAQESVSPCDFGGFCRFGKLVRRRSRCCGNVGTRVLCGFPSSEGNARTFESVSGFSALGASFPQQALDFVAFRTGCICEPVIRLKCTPFRKPRRMRTSPDSCTEPKKRLCTTICKKVHSMRLSGKRRIRSWWLPSAALSATGNRGRGNPDHGATAL